jgi:23S rRNA (uracil1939-C5)-methyltransferase
VYCINPKLNDTVLDREMIVYSGVGYVEERLDHVRFRIGPKSFFQTNTRQAETLYRIVADFAGLRGEENVYDLYTGLGGIALYLAHQCRRVVGIEEVEAAADDARANAALNGIHNAVFQAGDVRELLRHEFAERHGRPDLLVTDPPRAGMHPDVTKVLIALAPPRIVYVSCNPATQARDLRELSPYYTLSRSQAVDLFPHTHHVENVALLEKK